MRACGAKNYLPSNEPGFLGPGGSPIRHGNQRVLLKTIKTQQLFWFLDDLSKKIMLKPKSKWTPRFAVFHKPSDDLVWG